MLDDKMGRASSGDTGASETARAASALPTRKVRAGTHFAAPAASVGNVDSGEVARPAGRRFAASVRTDAAPSDGRPQGARFSRPPEAPKPGETPRPAGKRFAPHAQQPPSPSRQTPVQGAVSPMTTEQWIAIASSSKRVSAPARTPAATSAARARVPAPQPDAPMVDSPHASRPDPVAPVVHTVGRPSTAGAPYARTGQVPPRADRDEVDEDGASVTASMPALAAEANASPVPVEPMRVQQAPRPISGGGEPPRGGRGHRDKAAGSGSGRGSKLSLVLIVLGVILLVVAAGIFISAQIGYRQAQESYAELQRYAVSSDEGDGVPDVDFDALAEINPDVVGWIYIPGTVVNYPVVQTDDNTTYLTTLFDLSGNGSGAIFMDMDDTAPGMIDQQTTLYGHHMYDGSMLKVIDNTTNQADFDKIETVYYITRDATYTLTPMFTAQVEDTYVDARKPNFTGEGESLQGYLEDIYAYAKAQAPDAQERIATTDKVMSLVTCAGEIIPRTTRAVMVLSVDAEVARR